MGKLKGFIGLLLVAAGFYVAWNMIPPYWNHYQLQDGLDDIARKGSYSGATDDQIKKDVIAKAAAEDINLKEEQVTVVHDGSRLDISVKYRIHVDMILHPVDLDFTANSINKRI
jgi:Domain of unknown function (DUF4845)